MESSQRFSSLAFIALLAYFAFLASAELHVREFVVGSLLCIFFFALTNVLDLSLISCLFSLCG